MEISTQTADFAGKGRETGSRRLKISTQTAFFAGKGRETGSRRLEISTQTAVFAGKGRESVMHLPFWRKQMDKRRARQ